MLRIGFFVVLKPLISNLSKKLAALKTLLYHPYLTTTCEIVILGIAFECSFTEIFDIANLDLSVG